LGGGKNIVGGRIAKGTRQRVCRVAMRAIESTMPVFWVLFHHIQGLLRVILPLWKIIISMFSFINYVGTFFFLIFFNFLFIYLFNFYWVQFLFEN
jgi:hypothetical protein